jgi:uncharacterized protein YacL
MNTNRLIWFATTLGMALAGAIVGRWAGLLYTAVFDQPQSPLLEGKSLGALVVWGIAAGMAIVCARLGSWIADRFVIPRAARFHAMSVADRLLSAGGALLGLVFGTLVTLPMLAMPDRLLWLPVQLCVMAVCAAIGMAFAMGLRSEMLRVFPVLHPPGEAPAAAPSAPSARPKLLDTNIIIDGRMADVCKTGFIDGPLLVPSFILNEVQFIADSADAMRRSRGRRGLEVLNQMHEVLVPQWNPKTQAMEEVPIVRVLDDIPPEVRRVETVDAKLVALARHIGAAVMTNDFNLNRVAELQGVTVLNVNQLVQSLKPVVLPGEEMSLSILKEGKEAGQGVGYLDDGTMVVVSDGHRHIGETCKVVISSVYQTVAGKMIFADLKSAKTAGDDLFASPSNASAPATGGKRGRR